jgi:hypothetical protein
MILVSLVLALAQQSAAPAVQPAPVRPRDPFVFRCVLDKRARMLVAALDEEMWVAWDTTNGGFYKAWTGGVAFDGAVYTTVHGPQPTMKGQAYVVGDDTPQWSALVDGKPVACAVRYQGYTLEKGEFVLEWKINFGDAREVLVHETAQFGPMRRWWINDADGDGKQPALQRAFRATGLRAGEEIRLTCRFDAAPWHKGQALVNERLEVLDRGVTEAGEPKKELRNCADVPLTAARPRNDCCMAFKPISLPGPAEEQKK